MAKNVELWKRKRRASCACIPVAASGTYRLAQSLSCRVFICVCLSCTIPCDRKVLSKGRNLATFSPFQLLSNLPVVSTVRTCLQRSSAPQLTDLILTSTSPSEIVPRRHHGRLEQKEQERHQTPSFPSPSSAAAQRLGRHCLSSPILRSSPPLLTATSGPSLHAAL